MIDVDVIASLQERMAAMEQSLDSSVGRIHRAIQRIDNIALDHVAWRGTVEGRLDDILIALRRITPKDVA